MEINFFEYLINIGIINKETFSNFVLDYHKIYSKKNFEENMKDLILNFFNNLSVEEKNFISINLVEKYFQSLFNKKIEKLKIVYMILQEKLYKIKFKYLFKWKFRTFLSKYDEIKVSQNYGNIKTTINKLNNKIKKHRNISNELDSFITMRIYTNRERKTISHKTKKKKIKNITSSINESTTKKYDSTKESINPYNKKNNHKNSEGRLSSVSIKEQEELKECTFSPKINEFSKLRRSSDKKGSKEKIVCEIFNKLHNDGIIYKNKFEFNKVKYEQKLREEITFHPKINTFSKQLSENNQTFEERQKIYLEKKEKNSEKIKQKLDENFSKLCSFIPQVNINNNNVLNRSKIKDEPNTEKKKSDMIIDYYSSRSGEGIEIIKQKSPFMRLYEESKNRNLRKIRRQKEYKDYIDDMANISCKKEINDVNYDKLNELYLYNKKNEIIKKTKQKVENEEGSTFKPDIYINNLSKNITSDFYERNKKFIKDKQNFIESSIKERDKLFNINNNENKKTDRFSKEEKNEIIKNIVKRLACDYREVITNS